MRKLIVSIHSTANDIVTGPASDETNFMAWAQAGIEDSLQSFLKSLAAVDTILLGRATYEDLVRKWPKAREWRQVSDVILRMADKINATPKIVVTRNQSLALEWGEFEPPTRLSGPRVEQQIKELKVSDGGEIITFGSPTLVQSLTNAGLVDEYRLLIHPVIVNEGQRLFEKLTGRTDLRLISVDSFAHGAILIRYAPIAG